MERTQEEIFQEENKLIAGRIQKIAETIKEANPQADCFGTSLLFCSKDNSPIKGIAFMEIYLEKPVEKGFYSSGCYSS
ncbi:MAG: hypothetical protein G01um10147_574 [Microgenomates group bacterium Gr01-1014_7]|nr:MAG: hypothetical protein G01um10147_574 [Microgenomates group bacterium Gr01-1014_7]